jgi:hypothetical protein
VFEPDRWVVNRDLDGQVAVSYTDDTAELTPDGEAAWLKPAGQVLVIDGQNHTASYTACLNQAGYTTGTPSPRPVPDAGQIDAVADASATWAACAR